MDSREASEEIPETLVTVFDVPEDVAVFDGFKDMDEAALKKLYSSLNLAMTFKDFLHIQNYYKNEEHRSACLIHTGPITAATPHSPQNSRM